MLDCYYMDISGDCSKEQSLALYEILSLDRRNRIDKLKDPRIAAKQLKAGAFLQYVIGNHIGVPAQDVEFAYNEYGKPMLKKPGCNDESQSMDLHFNLSHSGDYAVVAISDKPVGIDIERKRKDRIKIARRCFCREEYEDIISRNDELSREEKFLEYWTLKEAYIKYAGKGLAIPLNSFLVVDNNDGYTIVPVEDNVQLGNDVLLYSFKLNQDYRISICVSKENVWRPDGVAPNICDIVKKTGIYEVLNG